MAANGTYAVPRLRDKLEETTLQKEVVQEKLARTVDRLHYSAETALAYLELLRNPGELYRNAPDNVRRSLLQAFFTWLRIYEDGHTVHIEAERSEADNSFRDAAATVRTARSQTPAEKSKTPHKAARSSDFLGKMPIHLALGLNKSTMAGVPGLEPRTKVPETSVLPITPYPKVETRRSEKRGTEIQLYRV